MLVMKDEKYERAPHLSVTICTEVVKWNRKNTDVEVEQSIVQITALLFTDSVTVAIG